ncbi:MAG: RecB family exonuclease [Dehalococcoidia bacterium]
MRPIHQTSAKYASDCLAKYKACVIDNLDTGGPYASLGTAVHAAIEAAYRASATGNREPIDAALDGLDSWWATRDKATTPVWVYAEAERLLRSAYGEDSRLWLRLPGRGQKIAVEQEWALDEEFQAVKPGEPCAYAGRIDILEWGPKGVRIRDVKTTYAMPSSQDIAYDVQAQVYVLAALSLFPKVDEATFELIMVRHGYSVRRSFRRGAPWEMQTKRWLRRVREAVRAAHEGDEWPATPGDGCHYCPISERCDELATLKAIGQLPDDVSPEQAARTYCALKGIVSKADRVARAAAADHPIEIGIGKVLGLRPGTRKYMRPLSECLAQFRADGVTDEDIAECFPGASVTKDGLEKLAVRLLSRGEIEGEPHEWVAMFREERPSTTFTTWAMAGVGNE